MWAPKKVIRIVVVAAVAIAMLAPLWAYLSGSPAKTLRLPARTYTLLIKSPAGSGGKYGALTHQAQTAGDRARGLGGVDSLPADHGMLFTYTGDQQRCFWMENMRFAIDIIWVDHNKQITHIVPDVSPSTFPATFCYVGQYVIELNAGEAARNALQPGQTITF